MKKEQFIHATTIYGLMNDWGEMKINHGTISCSTFGRPGYMDKGTSTIYIIVTGDVISRYSGDAAFDHKTRLSLGVKNTLWDEIIIKNANLEGLIIPPTKVMNNRGIFILCLNTIIAQEAYTHEYYPISVDTTKYSKIFNKADKYFEDQFIGLNEYEQEDLFNDILENGVKVIL